MGFLHGRVSFERFTVGGREFNQFSESHLETLDEHAIGKTGAMSVEGTEVGFAGGDHILDLSFNLEKNIINDALHFGLRVDMTKLPSDLLRAYEAMELAALAAESENGFVGRAQRQTAKKNAKDRLTNEAEDGRFRRLKLFTSMWDSRQKLLYFAGSSLTVLEQFGALFNDAFKRPISRLTAGTIAHAWAKKEEKNRAYEDCQPTIFAGDVKGKKMSVSWVPAEYGSKDFLGNEMLLWLWWLTDAEGDTVELEDGTSVTLMLTKTLTLECPLAETGKETISHESPVTLPEAKRAAQSGKWPRKSGLTMVRHDESYELTLSGESLSVSGAALPKLESGSPRAELEDRIDQIRHLTETLDLLYFAFLKRRFSDAWESDTRKIRAWLKAE
jgi:hypothetical protein